LVVSTSCSLLHVPVDLDAEPALSPTLRQRLAFARQKVDEVVDLGRILSGTLSPAEAPQWTTPAEWRDDAVRTRLDATLTGRAPFAERSGAQAARLDLPPLPTTTIGSFPQTDALRMARADLRTGRIDENAYADRMRAEVADVVKLQERLGLDVLVHGEPERNDMVQYFAEAFEGFAATENGWVQSYGSRCVRPPILYADVSRPRPVTVEWAAYAQSLTGKPVKGMLTGPVTILAWSFVRDDQPLADTAMQVALALRDEAADLEAAGIGVIQVDEPALRELLPPRRRDHAPYLDWAVASFRTATGGVADSTQVHTHLCYSEFGEVLSAIDDLDADVTSIEASRSRMEVLEDLRELGYARGIGPGVYDIHSPRVPSVEEIAGALQRAAAAVPPGRLWVNPDCGLKTRGYVEVEAALANLVQAAATVRQSLT
jgi:5-methyltetrahydropteroyltriglutamate--homocysteine methyltransferase